MDASCERSVYGGTPEATPVIPNDSGYITASPSPLCNESPHAICNESERRSKCMDIRDTPICNQKSNKIASLRKYLLKESYSNTVLQTNIEESEVSASNTQCSLCLPVANVSQPSVIQPLSLDSNKALTECFCHLKVDDDDSVNDKHFPQNSVGVQKLESTISREDEILSNSKNKSKSFLGSLTVKKFKSDSDNVQLPVKQTIRDSSVHSCNFIGVSRLDILAHLSGYSGCFPGIVSQILGYLPAQDLVSVCMVSTEWRKVCVADPVANNRRLLHVRHIKHTKENVSWNEFKQSSHILNLSMSTRKGIFREIQNTDRRTSTSSTPPNPRSPPVSPSKVRFTMFVKAGVALDEGKRLVRCPRCSHPSQASFGHACCQAVGCQYNFCLLCLCDSHEGLPCPTRSVIPARRRTSCVGSKESRRNLRRL